jgi:condensin complex subunit 1
MLLARVVAKFGTTDLEWFCVCETVLNCLFGLKQRISHEYAKHFIDSIVQKMFRQRGKDELEHLQSMVNEVELMPVRQDITDLHFSQLFFVIGHVAIKMLSFVEVLEAELKQALANSYKKQEESKNDDLA